MRRGTVSVVNTMLLSNSLRHQLVSTFDRISGAGGDASLTYKTVGGKVSAVLEVQLGPPSTTHPAAPEAPHQAAGSQKRHQSKDILPLGAQSRRQVLGPGGNEGRLGRSTSSTSSTPGTSNSRKRAVHDGSGGRGREKFGFNKTHLEILKRYAKRTSVRVQTAGGRRVQRILEERKRNDSKPGGLSRYHISVWFPLVCYLGLYLLSVILTNYLLSHLYVCFVGYTYIFIFSACKCILCHSFLLYLLVTLQCPGAECGGKNIPRSWGDCEDTSVPIGSAQISLLLFMTT